MKEVVGVVVQEEVIFVNMPRDNVNPEDTSEPLK